VVFGLVASLSNRVLQLVETFLRVVHTEGATP
jgi:hypothetical protein